MFPTLCNLEVEHPLCLGLCAPDKDGDDSGALDQGPHVFDRTPLTAKGHPKRSDAFLFEKDALKGRRGVCNGQYGDICAAGIVPLLKQDGKLMTLLPEEDMNMKTDCSPGKKVWAPALGLFGGKVDSDDTHWMKTILRELKEESAGLLSPDALKHLAEFDPRNKDSWPDDVQLCAYLPNAKYLALIYPIPAEFAQDWISLPQQYEAQSFKGPFPTTASARRRSFTGSTLTLIQ